MRLRLLEGLPQEELRRVCLDADVAVDQLMAGWIGMFALEMMAMGKPVVAYIRPSLQEMLRGMPVVHADVVTLADVLRDVLHNSGQRAALSMRGPTYVRDCHSPDAISERLEALYSCTG